MQAHFYFRHPKRLPGGGACEAGHTSSLMTTFQGSVFARWTGPLRASGWASGWGHESGRVSVWEFAWGCV